MTDLFNELAIIFGESVGLITLIILVSGFVLLTAEFFLPGFSLLGIIGTLISLGGVIYRVLMGLSLTQFLILLVIWGLTVISCYILFIHSAKSGLLSHSKMFSEKPSLPYNYDEDIEKKLLLGKVGVVVSRCRPVGKAEIDGKEYEVLSENSYLDKDTNIKVIQITDDQIVVSKI
jgi:membrane-bound serine protease (ClpP class)